MSLTPLGAFVSQARANLTISDKTADNGRWRARKSTARAPCTTSRSAPRRTVPPKQGSRDRRSRRPRRRDREHTDDVAGPGPATPLGTKSTFLVLLLHGSEPGAALSDGSGFLRLAHAFDGGRWGWPSLQLQLVANGDIRFAYQRYVRFELACLVHGSQGNRANHHGVQVGASCLGRICLGRMRESVDLLAITSLLKQGRSLPIRSRCTLVRGILRKSLRVPLQAILELVPARAMCTRPCLLRMPGEQPKEYASRCSRSIIRMMRCCAARCAPRLPAPVVRRRPELSSSPAAAIEAATPQAPAPGGRSSFRECDPSVAAGQIAEHSLQLQTLILASSASWRFTSRWC
jgi:hypothetical protein